MGLLRATLSLTLLSVALACTKAPTTPTTTTEPRASLTSIELRTALALRSEPVYAPLEHALPRIGDEPRVQAFGVMNGGGSVVPAFRLTTRDGASLNSAELLGNEPLVFVFFATWCNVCTHKMPALRQALETAGPIRTVLISVDDESTWYQVPDYLREQRIDAPLVSGKAHPNFVVSYNPFHAVPLVVVIGSDGSLVDYQMGYSESHAERLTTAIQVARTASLPNAPVASRGEAQPSFTGAKQNPDGHAPSE